MWNVRVVLLCPKSRLEPPVPVENSLRTGALPDTETVGAVSVLAVNVLTVSGVLALKALNLLSNVVCKSTPAKYSGPASIMLDPIVAEPLTSIDGTLTGAENRALPAAIPNLSTPSASARLKVPDAGFTLAHVS